ncbi:MAG TPA: T9SS type A sorting domain-containing protein, partial [Candidatus Cloacimonas sp.]|nr:T9SS type A sorting domain-containing protein [Candidatus Cloacimonas sp.]
SSYPNPFAASTTINYSLVKAGRIELKIFNLKGQLVKKLVEGNCKASAYTANWDGKDEQGRTVASGVYFCILTADGKSTSQKMLLLK